MSEMDSGEVSRLAKSLATDQSQPAIDRLFPLVYAELRGLAGHYFKGERGDHTLQPTALVHEAYLRLLGPDVADSLTRTHFIALSARAMRRVLIDHARSRDRLRRGGQRRRVALDPDLATDWSVDELRHLSGALDQLSELDARQARVVELRFFGGLKMQEVADVLGVSKRTAEDDWAHARAWLRNELDQADAE